MRLSIYGLKTYRREPRQQKNAEVSDFLEGQGLGFAFNIVPAHFSSWTGLHFIPIFSSDMWLTIFREKSTKRRLSRVFAHATDDIVS